MSALAVWFAGACPAEARIAGHGPGAFAGTTKVPAKPGRVARNAIDSRLGRPGRAGQKARWQATRSPAPLCDLLFGEGIPDSDAKVVKVRTPRIAFVAQDRIPRTALRLSPDR